jgi:hypothetical protein
MKKYPLIIALAGILFLSKDALSQQRGLKLDLNYVAGIPTGNLRNLSDQVSWRGWEAAIMYGITNQISVGVGFGTQDFYQKYPRAVYHSPGADISAVVTNSIQTSPVLAKGRYLLTPTGVVRPFVGLGVGADFVHYRKFYGEFVDEDTRVKFAGQGEAGIDISFGSSRLSGFHISGAYNYLPYKFSDADGLSHVSVKAGITIGL